MLAVINIISQIQGSFQFLTQVLFDAFSLLCCLVYEASEAELCQVENWLLATGKGWR